VLKDREIGVEHLVGFANWHGEPEPISRRRKCSGLDTVCFEERVDSIHRSLGWLDVLLDLGNEARKC